MLCVQSCTVRFLYGQYVRVWTHCFWQNVLGAILVLISPHFASISCPNNFTFQIRNNITCISTNVVVYAIANTTCNVIYIGETDRKNRLIGLQNTFAPSRCFVYSHCKDHVQVAGIVQCSGANDMHIEKEEQFQLFTTKTQNHLNRIQVFLCLLSRPHYGATFRALYFSSTNNTSLLLSLSPTSKIWTILLLPFTSAEELYVGNFELLSLCICFRWILYRPFSPTGINWRFSWSLIPEILL